MKCKHRPDMRTELVRREEGKLTEWFKCQHCEKSQFVVHENGKRTIGEWKEHKRMLYKWSQIQLNHQRTRQVDALL